METYIIVRLSNKENSELTDEQFRKRMGYVRKVLHEVYEDIDIHGADIVTGTSCMSEKDSKEVGNIFDRSLRRARAQHEAILNLFR